MMPNQLAPIVLFVYGRAWHTEQTLRALKQNDLAEQSTLYIYADGPKHLAPRADRDKIEDVRRLVRSEKWCGDVIVVESPHNLGLVKSFVKGVTEVVNRHGRVIVLEDDQITSRGFLKFMNEALDIYEDDEKVMHVSGYMFPARFESKQTTFFLDVQTCPGWGTWKRAWDHYEHDALDHFEYFNQSRRRRRKFDIEGHAYFFAQLKKNVEVPDYSWAVRWYASCSRAGGLALFPARSLVRNIGMDGTGMHCAPTRMYDVVPAEYLEVYRVPIKENPEIRRSVDGFYREHIRRGQTISLRSVAAKVLSSVGTHRVRSVFRSLLEKIVPELAQLRREPDGFATISSQKKNSEVNERATLHPPYHIHESRIGAYTYIARGSWVSMTTIGKFCSIGINFYCGWGVHPVDCVSTSPMFYSTAKQNGSSLCDHTTVHERRPIRVGNDVMIGMNVTVLDGVTIGDGAVIGAGTVVSRDVPPYAIAVGNPMRIARYRFAEGTIKRLLELAWWDWPEESLKRVAEHFFDVERFLEECKDLPGDRGGNPQGVARSSDS
jgi:acetyltransferase-like isoleucine patch superfamily enzyme